MKIEVRNDKAIIDGYVNAVGRDSRPISSAKGKFIEQVTPGAFRASLENRKDVDLLLNHRADRKLGSTGGGELVLYEDSIGLRAHAEISDAETVEKARANKLRGWSFGMFTNEDDYTYEERAGDIPRRHLKSLDMFEVSLIDNTMMPCYAGTSVECRADGDVVTETRSFEDNVEITTPPDLSEQEKRLEALRAEISIADAEYRLWKLKQQCGVGGNVSPEFRYNHNHDPQTGRFASGNGLTSGGKSSKIDSKGVPFEKNELRLPKKEYGKVIHEINSAYYSKYEGKSTGLLFLGKTTYSFEIHGFDDYNIFDKEED